MPEHQHPGHAGPSRVRFAFLDGLRGLAALYVVLHHAAVEIPEWKLHKGPKLVWAAFSHGHYAVAVFIVLSGFCLTLPVARDPQGRLRGGFLSYLGRRARRILPTYYAALVFCVLMVALSPSLQNPGPSRWMHALPVFGTGVVLSHLALVHNLWAGWFFKIDPPAWSVATEWQIYLLFPALLALRRRAGSAATVAAGLAFGWALAWLSVPFGQPALWMLCPWYVGLFAMGMAAAVACTSGARLGGSRPLAWAFAALVALVGPLLLDPAHRDIMMIDPIVGAVSALLIVACARRAAEGRSSRLLRLLESRRALSLGSVSYSLYLIHFPLLSLAAATMRARGLGAETQLILMLGVASPLCVLAARVFHRAFERPFLADHAASQRPRTWGRTPTVSSRVPEPSSPPGS